MRALGSKLFVISAEIDHGVDDYRASVPAIRSAESIAFRTPVTMFIGENGSGKSTLIEAIAIAAGFNPEGGSKNFLFETVRREVGLDPLVRLVRAHRRPSDGYFLRAESFMALLLNRFLGDGLYVLDEPEAALSPMRQLSMLARIHDLVRAGSQFIIATHSPILMAYRDATLLLMDQTIHEVAYEETEHYTVMRDFFNHRAAMLRELMG